MKRNDWITLKGISLHGKNIIRNHGDTWLVCNMSRERKNRICIESKEKTFKNNDVMQHDVRWISTVDSADFEVIRHEGII